MRALRRDPASADALPRRTCWSCRATSAGETRVPGVRGDPGQGHRTCRSTSSGSSLFGATLAAALGLPYAFASHFAPAARCRPPSPSTAASSGPPRSSTQPYVIAGVNVIAADTAAEAQEQLQAVRRIRGRRALRPRATDFTDEEADQLLAQGAAQHVDQMLTYTAVGTPDEVGEYLEGFAKHADADELIVAHQAPTTEARLRSVDPHRRGLAGDAVH